MTSTDFKDQFKDLTGKGPLSWQIRLYEEWFVHGRFPSLIDLPTGMGKTMIMAIWLIARKNHPEKIPTRLIYVVDRRTVVDQATDLANGLQNKFGEDKLAISTLRGQRADNREWSADPSRPAIIIGTVDLVGSALLFSGYRSSHKRRPLEAGLLGQDSLLVLDEAHLSRPFGKLLESISSFQTGHGKPTRIIQMSATGQDHNGGQRFTLTDADFQDPIINQRFGAKKTLEIIPLGEKEDLDKRLARAAIELAANADISGKRIVVFTRKPDDARSIAEAIRKDGSKKAVPGPHAQAVEVLTGTMQGLERDKLVEKPVFRDRWLNGDLKSADPTNQSPVFLVATSAGEVGFDLNADHMICDATTIESLIQRLGRVNRRGFGDAVIQLFIGVSRDEAKQKRLEAIDRAIASTVAMLAGVRDVSPKRIAELRGSDWKAKYSEACSPEPTTVALTDILLDAWSMTSIAGKMPGRPEVAPWLRGLEREQAQTTIAWRAELDLFRDDRAPEKALQAIFTKHAIRPHESLTVNTGQLLDFLKRIAKLKDRSPDLMATRAAVRMPRGQVICRTLEELSGDPGVLYADSTLILPATFGGLDKSGMLDAESIPAKKADGVPELRSYDVADHGGYEQADEDRARLRIVIERTDDGSWRAVPRPGLPIPEDIRLDASYDTSRALLADVKAADLRLRLVQPIKRDEEGNAVQSLAILVPTPKEKARECQALVEHVKEVEQEAIRLADQLHLAEDDPIRVSLLFAARWHDEGKKAEIWQWFAHPDPADPPDPAAPKGKMAQSRDPKSLRGYRHEFGSLLRIHYPDQCGTLGCDIPAAPDACELALHLIATHHGAGRPHFAPAVYDPFTDVERDAVHTETIRRFARLQRKYGWWYLAWLENLLRCADQRVSADEEVTAIDELEEAGQ